VSEASSSIARDAAATRARRRGSHLLFRSRRRTSRARARTGTAERFAEPGGDKLTLVVELWVVAAGFVVAAETARLALTISAIAVVVSAGSAAVAALTHVRTRRWHMEGQLAAVVAFRLAIRRKTVLTATESLWRINDVDTSVMALRNELLERVMELPPSALGTAETTVGACTRLLHDLRPWSQDSEAAEHAINDIPDALSALKRWISEMHAELKVLDSFGVPDDGDRRARRGRRTEGVSPPLRRAEGSGTTGGGAKRRP
jgi:hypothetical protein